VKGILLFSGGLDSTVSLSRAVKETDVEIALTFDYGQRAANKEIEASGKICREYGIRHQVIELAWLAEVTSTALVNKEVEIPLNNFGDESAKKVWVPNRNGIFVNIAAGFAEGLGLSRIITGFNQEEAQTFKDNSSEFVEAINQCLKLSTLSPVKVVSFTGNLKKDEIVSLGIKLGAPLRKIWCCYFGNDLMCGKCESCQRAIFAFRKAKAWEMIKDRFVRLEEKGEISG